MTCETFRAGVWLVREWRCCGLVWQVVRGGLQGRYFDRPAFRCPRCGLSATSANSTW